MEVVTFITLPLYWLLFSISTATALQISPEIPFGHSLGDINSSEEPAELLYASFPSETATLANVDALKHSNFSQWRSLEEVAKRTGGGLCAGSVNTSVLTVLYLLGLFNLSTASPASCCIPLPTDRRRRRSYVSDSTENPELRRLLDKLQLNSTNLSLEHFSDLPHVYTQEGGKIPVHISVVEQTDLKLSNLKSFIFSQQKFDTSSAKIQTDKQINLLSGKRKTKRGKIGRKYKKTERRKENEVLQTIPDQVNEKSQLNILGKYSGSTSANSPLNNGEGLAVTGPFDEDSLSDYFRNRDRRQAGSKRRGKTSSGIIKGPLLKQCRPGAKRDYNGHCRPKVILKDDVPAPKKKKTRLSQSSLPKIKCAATSRLDARGVCRTTLNGLG